MLVSITGGSGFIGRLLVQKHLHQGDEVRVLSRQSFPDRGKLRYFYGDLHNASCNLEKFINGADVLYHCAAEIADESVMHSLHVDATTRLAKVAAGNIGRWVQLSSVGAYGPCLEGVVNESDLERPVGVYETTKTQADNVLFENSVCKNFELVVLRPSIVFGEMMPNQSLAQMSRVIRKGLFFYIGPSGAVVNYVHVSDVVKALLVCATHNKAKGNTYILSCSVSLEEMVEAVCKGLNAKMPTLRLPEYPIRLLVKTLGKYPYIPLTEGRVDALTGRCIYDASAICNDLDYSFEQPLVSAFRNYAASL